MVTTVPLGSLLLDGQVSYGVVQPGSSGVEGIPVVRAGDIRNGVINDSAPLRVEASISARHSRTILSGGELLFSVVGTVGETAIVPAQLAGWNVARAVAVLRPVGVSTRWLHYALRSPDVLRQVDSFLNTTVQPTLNLADLKRVAVPLVPRAEQQEIAEVLGALDDKIAANTKLAATADELAGHIYDTSVRGWNRQPMSALLTPILGGTPSRANDEFWAPSTDLWVSARDITAAPSRVVFDTAEKISQLATNNTKAKPLPVGSVVLTARGTVGAVARLARPAAFNQSCYGFSPGVVPAEVLFFSVLRASEHAQKIAHGSVFDTITKSTFDHLEMAWETSGATELSAKLAPLFRAIDTALEENRTLAATRDALLPQLMSGKLRVRDIERVASEVGA